MRRLFLITVILVLTQVHGTDSACGGYFTTNVGSFSSPNYPSYYGSFEFCSWTIKVTDGYVIRLTFSAFDLEDYNYDFVKVFDVQPGGQRFLRGTWTGQNHPPKMQSLFSSLVIEFSTDINVERPGFSASWSRTLNASDIVLKTGPRGDIKSPNYPFSYPDNLSKRWEIVVPLGHIVLNFTSFNLGHSCSGDTIEIFDVMFDDSLVSKGKWCASNVPPSIKSVSSRLLVKLNTDNVAGNNGLGFVASWNSNLVCGDFITKNSGLLSFPNGPLTYINDRRLCEWNIKVTDGYAISLNFLTPFYVQGQYNFVRVFDVLPNGQRSLRGTWAGGSNRPPPFTSSSSTIGVELRIDTRGLGTKFSASWSIVDIKDCIVNNGGCSCGVGLQFNGSKCIDVNECVSNNGGCDQVCTNIIGSRYCGCYSGYRQDGTKCTDVNECLSDNGGCDQHCSNTFGSRICSCDPGYEKNGIKCSDIDECLEHSDSCDQICTNAIGSYTCSCHSGFTQTGNSCTDTNECLNQNGGCDQTCTNTVGSYTCSCHLGYRKERNKCIGEGNCKVNSDCGNNQECLEINGIKNCACKSGYKFKVTEGTCEDIDECHYNNGNCSQHCQNTIGSYRCKCHSGFTSNGTLCQDNDECQDSNGGCNQICTNTEGSYECSCRPGFEKNGKKCYDTSCGGNITNTRGTITSPNFPSSYNPDSLCKWIINVDPGSVIKFQFNDFLLENANTDGVCENDYVKVFDILPNGNHLERGIWCGNSIPPVLRSSTSSMEVWLKSNDKTNRKGFEAVWNKVDHVVCGGILSERDGKVIEHPDSPSVTRYDNAEYCKWTISVEDGYAIHFNFNLFELEPHDNFWDCSFDGLKITDISTSGTHGRTSTWCGTILPFNFTSSTSKVEVEFQSNEALTYRGFKTTWSKVVSPSCHFKLTGSEGTITAAVPSIPMDKINCEWDVTVPRDQTISLTFPTFKLHTKRDGSCGDDYVEIFELLSDSSQVKRGQWCGTNNPPVIRSSGMQLVVKFHTDDTINYNGPSFAIDWEADGMRDTDVPGGTLHSPNYPALYLNEDFRRWTIEVKSGHFVRLTFNQPFEFEHSDYDDRCVHDYVTVFDVLPNGNRLRRGTFCGDIVPPNITSSTSKMEVEFVSDDLHPKKGFSADWFEVDHALCGGKFTEGNVTKVIEHPASPKTLFGNAEYCKWSVKVEDGYVIQFHFDFLHMEDEDRYKRCTYDKLKITEISSDGHRRVAKTWCGIKPKFYFISSTSMVDIEFQSDEKKTYRGFKTTWSKVEPPSCHTKLTGLKGKITPSIPPVTMEWVVTVPRDQLINVVFPKFKLNTKPDGTCGYDYVEIFDVLGDGSKVIRGHWCGSNTPPVMKSSRMIMAVKFHVDKTITYQDPPFVADWEADGTRKNTWDPNIENGTLLSSNYPSNYDVDNICRWAIDANPGHYIQLTFNQLFDLEDPDIVNKECYDYVKVFDIQSNGHDLRRGTWCGRNVPPVIRSSTSKMEVEFLSDDSDVSQGFSADWLEVDDALCGGHFTERNVSKVIEYPGSPKTTYGNAEYCKWSIEVEDGYVVQFHFEFLHLDSPGYHKTCKQDTLKITDISTNGVRSQPKTLCETETPLDLITASSKVDFEFQSDEALTFRGFKTIWSKVEKSCGGNFNNKTGTIQSPNYPSNYNPYTSCKWTIDVDEGLGIKLVFNHFDLEGTDSRGDCSFDYLKTYEVTTNRDYPLINTFCGTSKPADIITYHSKTEVEFFSDGSVSNNGFSLSFSIVDNGCGGDYNSQTGTIQSPNYPSNYHLDTSCQWTINVERGYHIKLHFNEFKLSDPTDDCRQDYVKITNVRYFGWHEVMNVFCGTTKPSDIEIYDSSKVEVLFVSDDSHVDKGFSLSWSIEKDVIIHPLLKKSHDNGRPEDSTDGEKRHTRTDGRKRHGERNESTAYPTTFPSTSLTPRATAFTRTTTFPTTSTRTITFPRTTTFPTTSTRTITFPTTSTRTITFPRTTTFPTTSTRTITFPRTTTFPTTTTRTITFPTTQTQTTTPTPTTSLATSSSPVVNTNKFLTWKSQTPTSPTQTPYWTTNAPTDWTETPYWTTDDYDACMDNNGGCDQICTNTYWSYSCSCYSGYTSHGNQCIDNGPRLPTPTATIVIITTVTPAFIHP